MHELIDAAIDALEFGEECILCTVVRLEGSGYGQPGTRLLLTADGERIGHISGGCLERDLCRRVWSATQSGARLFAFDTRNHADSGAFFDEGRYNTGCEGVVYVLCQRLTSKEDLFLQVARDVYQQGQPVTLLTVYRSDSPEINIGDGIALGPEGILRTTSPPLVEAFTPHVGLLRAQDQHRTIEWNDGKGNKLEAAIELLEPPMELVILGAGDDVLSLHAFAQSLGWKVTIIGNRPEHANAARFPGANVLCGDWRAMTDAAPIHSATHVILMTHDFAADVDVIPTLLESPAKTIGLMGSKRRLARLIDALYAGGRTLSAEEAGRLRSPIGLDIGADRPEEIALSITAELLALARERSGGILHERSRPLHERRSHQFLRADADRAQFPAHAVDNLQYDSFRCGIET